MKNIRDSIHSEMWNGMDYRSATSSSKKIKKLLYFHIHKSVLEEVQSRINQLEKHIY